MDRDPNFAAPAVTNMTSRMPGADRLPEPGNWWRVSRIGDPPQDVGEAGRKVWEKAASIADTILDRSWQDGVTPPAHGTVLLLTDARYVDGELHSLVLAPHPGWAAGYGMPSPVKLLLAEFDLIMIETPDGAALRAAEEGALMGFVGQLTTEMGQAPDPAEVAAIVAKKAEEEARKAAQARARLLPGPGEAGAPEAAEAEDVASLAALVPAALLPSRDLQQAEAAVRHQMRLAEANREIIEARVARVKTGMETVSRFQEEKVATAMAGMSRQRQFAEQMLSSVHTMKLWLGQGVNIVPMIDGSSAPADEPVRFMQQLLYLDEEIFTKKLVGEGFSSDHFSSLQALLQENPGMVTRMLPYERCICITRVRRHRREFEIPGNWAAVMDIVQRHEQDMKLQIFVKDGERLTMIMADDETSGAPRLFPSKAEIDGIFVDRGYGRDARVIDVRDVQYADKRRDHDKTALFYKRLLLILWGGHEREGILGDFPKGLNWLTGSTHSERFQFIHDEEMGLHEDRQPVLQWIDAQNRAVRPGSMVIATWSRLFSSDRAPGAWSNTLNREAEQIRFPVRNMEKVQVVRKGEALFVSCPCERQRWRDDNKVTGISVRIQDDAAQPGTLAGGVLCLDNVRAAELRTYIGSRTERKSYLSWLGEFQVALPLVEERECMEAALVERLATQPGVTAQVNAKLADVAHEAVLAAGWSLPPEQGDAGLIKQARRLVDDVPIRPEDLKVVVRQGGEVLRYSLAEPILGGLADEKFWVQDTCSLKADGRLSVKSSRVVQASPFTALREISIHGPEELPAALGAFGLKSLADREDAISLTPGDGLAEKLDYILNPTSDTVDRWVAELLELNASGRYVRQPILRLPVGLAIVPPSGDRWGRQRGTVSTMHVISIELDRLAHAWLAGHQAEARRFSRIYADPAKFTAKMEARVSHGSKPTASIQLTYALEGKGLRDVLKDPEGLNATTKVGYGEVQCSGYLRGEQRTYLHRAENGSLAEAVRSAVVRQSATRVAGMAVDERRSWLQQQKGTALFVAPQVEDGLLSILSMFERAPEPGCEKDMEI